jgi:hypothetical protein
MSTGELILYTTNDGQARINLRALDGTVWLTQQQLAELFGVSVANVSLHIQNVLAEGELTEEATIKEYLIVAREAARDVERRVKHYRLDMVLAVGYRVRSPRGTQFRQWATTHLRDYLVKGFVLDDQRFKKGQDSGYFDELLERIRDIRSSEKEFWRKVLDIFSTSVDYAPHTDDAKRFFATVQNKMHFAAHGKTAAEIIWQRSDAKQPYAGLTNWPEGKSGQPRRADAEIAKNYLQPDELNLLNRIVTAYLEFAELQALGRQAMTMAAWTTKLDEFIRVMGRDVLTHQGRISHDQAMEKARAQWDQYRVQRANEVSAVEVEFEKVAKRLSAKSSPRKSGK